MIHPDLVTRLRGTREWAAFQRHMQDAEDRLDRNADITGDDRTIAIEVIARNRAREILHDILQPFREYQAERDLSALAKDKEEDAGL